MENTSAWSNFNMNIRIVRRKVEEKVSEEPGSSLETFRMGPTIFNTATGYVVVRRLLVLDVGSNAARLGVWRFLAGKELR